MSRIVGLLTISACVLRAGAFLIPSGVALESNAGDISLTTLNAKSVALQVPCSECVFSPKNEEIKNEAKDDVFWIQGGANAVVLNFTVSEDGERLALNGEDIYPMQFLSDSLAKTYADQVPATATWEDVRSGRARVTPLELTGSGVLVESEDKISPQGDVMVAIRHTIFELEHQPVSIDAVSVKLLKTPAGQLLIAHVGTVERLPPRPNDAFGRPPPVEMGRFLPPIDEIIEELERSRFPPRPHHHHQGPPPERTGAPKECNILPAALCKLRNAVEAKVHGMKSGMRKGGCHGRPHMGQLPGHMRPHFMRPDHDDDASRSRHHGRPHHMRPHGHHHHHEHSFMHSFSSGLTAVLIPTLAGIAVGMTISLLGLVVGRLISFLWIKLYRGGRRGYVSVAIDDIPVDHETGKEVKVDEDLEDLPPYEQAPAYAEVME